MARTPSTMRELGSQIPTFVLPDTVSGQTLASRSLAGQIVVVAFICNHCPFVIHLKTALASFGRRCVEQGVRWWP